MRFEILTIFPGFFAGVFDHGVVRRAQANGLIQIHVHDLRTFAHDWHRTVDDRPFGGGEGMVLKPEPLAEAIESLGIPKKMANPWTMTFKLFGVDYEGYRLLIAAISILILMALWLFLYKTSYGILIRASIQDRDMASAMGIDVSRVLIITFVLGSILAAVGGVLAAPVTQVFYLMGNDVVLLAFIVVIIGGLGSLAGTLVAALGLSSLEGVMSSVLTPIQSKAAILVVMIIILMIRPRGLFGEREG